MSFFQHLQTVLRFFSLETLDTRLFPSSNPKKKQAVIQTASISRWGTLEFKFYLLVFAVVVPLMYKTAMDASNETNPNYFKYERILSDGWMFGRKVDNSDSQYRFFRDNFLMLVGLIFGHWSLRQFSLYLHIPRLTFDLIFGLVFLFGAHGYNCLKMLFHVLVMFLLGRLSSKNRKLSIALIWIYGVSTLFINDKYRSISYHQIWRPLTFMDDFEGIIARWDVFFNFTLLRMISFNMDYIMRREAILQDLKNQDKKNSGESPNSIPLTDLSENTSSEGEQQSLILDDRARLDAPLDVTEYSLANYVSYILYTPLFIAGPILTFNDYVYQSKHTLPTITSSRTIIYGLRLLFCILVMEFILHFIYVVAVSKAKAWQGDTPFQISMIGLFNLNIIWLKLLIPWRLFRFWALCDGIDPPENMIRCMDNNYSTMMFWRAWHRSYNKWVVRYIYVPLGGNNYRILSSLAVFSFVAIWHDIELKLLIWGWMIVLFLLPEMMITNLVKPYADKWWYRHLCACGAVVNIWMMMLANLFGFCLGKDGLLMLLKDMFTTLNGFEFFLSSSFCLWVAAQVMFEMREAEKRRGVAVKC
ncbi:hypothetical protein CANARDRAFT_200197 [[Candida] arabinofermentans NRRL YB-2248]|uniref:Glycerol uptake protein 1 n=1 Tax=[Candida] arabinofermentans NRRL YB-2248 TaxID=983967 RepID=A0A1E4SYW5_9ASCO|nr:hypothetical protein CANARDRAFT_200197 [[Candida] arabinofermentans NRRL YB-2248]